MMFKELESLWQDNKSEWVFYQSGLKACVIILLLGLSACSSQPWQVAPVEDRGWEGGVYKGTPAQPGADPTASKESAAHESSDEGEKRQVLAPEGVASIGSDRNLAVERLMAQADQASAKGYHQTALSYLQRALRISPRNAEVYLKMGQQRQALGQEQQACTLAQKGRYYTVNSGRIYRELMAILNGC